MILTADSYLKRTEQADNFKNTNILLQYFISFFMKAKTKNYLQSLMIEILGLSTYCRTYLREGGVWLQYGNPEVVGGMMMIIAEHFVFKRKFLYEIFISICFSVCYQ